MINEAMCSVTLICSDCKGKINISFRNEKQRALTVRKVGPYQLFCRSCAQNKHSFNLAGYKKQYVTCKDIQQQQKRQIIAGQSNSLDEFM